MVEAVAMRTTGLGGDSEVHFIGEGLQGGVTLGPRRLVPVSLMALDAPEMVNEVLDSQLRNIVPSEYDGRFVRAVKGIATEGLTARDMTVLERIGDAVQPLSAVLKNRIESQSLTRLVTRGIVQVAGVTPSDASHVLGRLNEWDSAAARKALALFGRRRTGAGEPLAREPEVMAQIIVDRLTYQTCLALLETAFAEEEVDFGMTPSQLAQHVLLQRGLDRHRGLMTLDAGLNLPVIGLGASAASYYPAVGMRLHCDVILHEHSGVANAIGAVVGRVTMRRSGTVTVPSEGRFRVHLETGPEDFGSEEAALGMLEAVLRNQAIEAAKAAGAVDIHVTVAQDAKRAVAEAREVFLEGVVTVEASGRPRIAEG